MAEFHFLRPLWLLLLPLVLWAAWRAGLGRGGRDGWHRVVDRVLQPHVLHERAGSAERRWPLVAALAAAILALLALAGPVWDRQPVPAYRSGESLVVALDLSRSMDAGDVAPSRLGRARIKLLDLLARRDSGETALVVFSSHAFAVAPLTNDTRTIAALVNSLSTDIMPSQGSLIEVALDKSASLLRQSGAAGGEILLLTDAVAGPMALERAAQIAASGIQIHVLAVGTDEGAPIPRRDGGFLVDGRGQVVVPALNAGNLERLANAGSGRFARLTVDDADLDYLFPPDRLPLARSVADDEERELEVWRDQGIWLVLVLLPLLALTFRRGFVYAFVPLLLLPLPRAEAFEFSDLWQRPDQQGARALERNAPAEAAALFEDPEWSAVANYRASRYADSAAALAGIDTPDANYNRGNALARAGQLAEAVDAYDRALELAPAHEDALYNRELVAELLEQQQQQQQNQNEGDESDEGEQSDQGEQADSQSQDQGGDGDGESSQQMAGQGAPEPGDGEPEPGDENADPLDGNDDGAGEEDDRAADAGQEPEADTADGPQMAASTPEEVDDWASEQAAEQWLRRIPQDPGGLLRRKFLYQYQQSGVDQDGNRIYRGAEAEPW